MTRTAVLLAALLLLIPRAAAACPVCFGADDGPILQGSNMGIVVLLVVTLAMLAVMGGFFITLARRAARAMSETPAALAAEGHREGGTR